MDSHPFTAFNTVMNIAKSISTTGSKIGSIPFVHSKDHPFVNKASDFKRQLYLLPFANLTRYVSSTYISEQYLATSIKLADDYYVNVNDQTEFIPLKSLDTGYLSQYSRRAEFGDTLTQTNVYDEKIRKAFEVEKFKLFRRGYMNHDGIKFYEVNLYNFLTEEILNQFESTFKISKSRFEMKPYKINIYSEGCFFKAHRDSPVKNLFATMILCLPTEFKGGELSVHTGNKAEYIDFSKLVDKKEDKYGLCLMYPNVVHGVHYVHSGSRITLTFQVVVNNDGEDVTLSQIEEELEAREPQAKKVKSEVWELKELIELCNVEKLGFILNNEYTYDQLEENQLKYVDKKLYDDLCKHFTVEIAPIAIVMDCEFGDCYNDNDECKYDIYSLSQNDLKALRAKEKPMNDLKDVPFIHSSCFGLEVYRNKKEGAEHVGNNSEPNTDNGVYLSAAFIVSKKQVQNQ